MVITFWDYAWNTVDRIYYKWHQKDFSEFQYNNIYNNMYDIPALMYSEAWVLQPITSNCPNFHKSDCFTLE